jgi:hypothetical protein
MGNNGSIRWKPNLEGAEKGWFIRGIVGFKPYVI